MEPWYRTIPRQEVREGRSFNPDEFAIALEQVVAGTAPEDYREPAKFFARTCFTSALREHAGTELVRSMVSELRQILQDLDLEDRLRIEQV
jgi:predicted AAA+ superfamily ATPase